MQKEKLQQVTYPCWISDKNSGLNLRDLKETKEDKKINDAR